MASDPHITCSFELKGKCKGDKTFFDLYLTVGNNEPEIVRADMTLHEVEELQDILSEAIEAEFFGG